MMLGFVCPLSDLPAKITFLLHLHFRKLLFASGFMYSDLQREASDSAESAKSQS